MENILLITCNTAQEAYLIKGRLENEGILTMVTHENVSALLPQYNGLLGAGVQVWVHQANFREACRIIGPEKSNPGIPQCPYCHSKNVRYGLGRQKWRKMFAALFSAVLWNPFGNTLNAYSCNDCHRDFTLLE